MEEERGNERPRGRITRTMAKKGSVGLIWKKHLSSMRAHQP
jgi:hypothetical protein